MIVDRGTWQAAAEKVADVLIGCPQEEDTNSVIFGGVRTWQHFQESYTKNYSEGKMITVKTLKAMIEDLPDDVKVIVSTSSDTHPGEEYEPYLLSRGYHSVKLRTFWDDWNNMAKDMHDHGMEPFDSENALVIYT